MGNTPHLCITDELLGRMNDDGDERAFETPADPELCARVCRLVEQAVKGDPEKAE
jgi:hypothetical protein